MAQDEREALRDQASAAEDLALGAALSAYTLNAIVTNLALIISRNGPVRMAPDEFKQSIDGIWQMLDRDFQTLRGKLNTYLGREDGPGHDDGHEPD